MYESMLNTQRTSLTYKDNSRRIFPGYSKQIADACGSHALKHFHKLRAVGGEEGHIRGACHGLGQVCLPRSRWAFQQYPLRSQDSPTGSCKGTVMFWTRSDIN